MAYTTPRTWVDEELVTAALLNTHLRDNMSYLYNVSDLGTGWIAADAMTYVSATTFTVTGDQTAKYTKGTRIKCTNTTVKYFVVVSSVYGASTTVTVTGGSDYALADAAITSPYYSYSNPPDFPGWFNWAPTQVGFSADPAGGLYRFRVDGNVCTLAIRQPAAGTSNANTFTISLPITAKTLADMAWVASGFATDNGTLITGMGYVVSAGTVLTLYKNLSATGWTTSGNKYLNAMSIAYEI